MKAFYIILLIILLGGGFYFVTKQDKTTDTTGTEMETTDHDGAADDSDAMIDDTDTTADDQMAMTDGEVKEFTVTGKNFAFSEKTITVKKGDRVRINFTSEEGFHDWVVDEFDAKTERVNAGESTSVEFIADTAGTFEYYCSVGNHRQLGMVGSLVVEE